MEQKRMCLEKTKVELQLNLLEIEVEMSARKYAPLTSRAGIAKKTALSEQVESRKGQLEMKKSPKSMKRHKQKAPSARNPSPPWKRRRKISHRYDKQSPQTETSR